MPDSLPASPDRFNVERSAPSPQVRGLSDAQLSAADRVLQRERSRSRIPVRFGASSLVPGAQHAA